MGKLNKRDARNDVNARILKSIEFSLLVTTFSGGVQTNHAFYLGRRTASVRDM